MEIPTAQNSSRDPGAEIGHEVEAPSAALPGPPTYRDRACSGHRNQSRRGALVMAELRSTSRASRSTRLSVKGLGSSLG